jgi:hypothetical protein
MAYERCPQCGENRHSLLACRNCGYSDPPPLPKKLSQGCPLKDTLRPANNPQKSRTVARSSLDELTDSVYLKCPHCSLVVRGGTHLKIHIQDAHKGPISIPPPSPNKRRKKVLTKQMPSILPSSASSRLHRCRFCGKPAIPGDDVCYFCAQSL